jgi:hypothetical protein
MKGRTSLTLTLFTLVSLELQHHLLRSPGTPAWPSIHKTPNSNTERRSEWKRSWALVIIGYSAQNCWKLPSEPEYIPRLEVYWISVTQYLLSSQYSQSDRHVSVHICYLQALNYLNACVHFILRGTRLICIYIQFIVVDPLVIQALHGVYLHSVQHQLLRTYSRINKKLVVANPRIINK